MRASLAPFLTFEGAAAEALDLYASAFREAETIEDRRYGEDGPGPTGTVELAILRIGDGEIRMSDSFVEHDHGFTPAISIFVELDSTDEVDSAFATLSKGGRILMPLAPYPFSSRFGWVDDRFGVSWQLSIAGE
jgi:predicted 3-demethylubiquinone-9 3-methyltransferase (glyoxalase superfamily)